MVGRASEAYGAETTKPAMPPKRGTEPETQLLLQHVQGCLKRKLQANAANKFFCLFLLHSGLACVGKKVTELRGCVVTQSGKKNKQTKKPSTVGQRFSVYRWQFAFENGEAALLFKIQTGSPGVGLSSIATLKLIFGPFTLPPSDTFPILNQRLLKFQ